MKICGFGLADCFMGKREDSGSFNIQPNEEETQSLLKRVLENEMNSECFEKLERIFCYLNTTKFYEYQDNGFALNINISQIARKALNDKNIVCLTRKAGEK